MVKEDPFLVMPEVSEIESAIDSWLKCGIASVNNGVNPLEWGEIESFSSFNFVPDYDACLIRMMSESYVKGIKSESKLPPYIREYTEAELIARSNSIIAEEENKDRK